MAANTDPRAVAFANQKVRALFATLAVQAGLMLAALGAVELMEAFWK